MTSWRRHLPKAITNQWRRTYYEQRAAMRQHEAGQERDDAEFGAFVDLIYRDSLRLPLDSTERARARVELRLCGLEPAAWMLKN